MLAMLQELVVTDNNSPSDEMPSPTAPVTPAANAVAYTDKQLEIILILQEM